MSNKIVYIQIIPYGTLIVNCLGCLFVGLYRGISDKFNLESESINLFFLTGFLGALTTCSTFGSESIKIFLSGETALFFVNIFFNVFLSFLEV